MLLTHLHTTTRTASYFHRELFKISLFEYWDRKGLIQGQLDSMENQILD